MINGWLVFLAVIGFSIAWYIIPKKGKESEIVCVIGKKCHVVLESKYNTTLGFRNDILGILYYLVVFALSLMFTFGTASVLGFDISLILLVFGIPAFLFSMYLVYIQFFVLKAVCDYCLASAVVNTLILIIELI